MIAEITDKKVNVKNVRVFCGDKNADFITFSVPKEYNGVSLENVPVYIKVKNQLGECRKKVLSSVADGDKLLVEWKIGSEATVTGGRLVCQLSFEKSDGTLVMNTQTFALHVGESIPDDLVADSVPVDHITQLQNDLQSKLEQVNAILSGEIVNKINGKTGYITLTAEDVGGLAEGDPVSKLENDSGYITGSGADAKITAHDGSTAAHSDIRQLIGEVKTVSDAATVTLVYETAEAMAAALQSFPATKLKKGDCIRVAEEGCPDFYVKEKLSQSVTFVFGTIDGLLEKVKTEGALKIGYYSLAAGSGTGGSGLPDVTADDAGKILKVSDDGAWEVVSDPAYGGETETYILFTVDGVKYYAQSGSRWAAWCASPFNNGNFVLAAYYSYGDCVSAGNGKYVFIEGANMPTFSSLPIVENGVYFTKVPEDN